MIHVSYGTSNLYSKFAGTSMLSMFENTSENVTVHILHDDTFTQENRDKFIYIAGQYNQQIIFYNVEKFCAAEIEEFKNKFSKSILQRFTVASTFRLLLPKIIPDLIEKIIYLDADTIVNLDIKELWRVDLEDKPLAAVVDAGSSKMSLCLDGVVNFEDYFNAGILLINLNKWRQNANLIGGGVEFITNEPKYSYADQDVLNYCFSKQYLKLPEKFNIKVRTERRLRSNGIRKGIYHFLARSESLGLDIQDKYHRFYWEYFAKTPWFNSESLLKMFTNFRKFHIQHQNLLMQITAIMSGKTRAFFTDSKNIDAIKNIFYVKDGEEILTLTSNESVQKLVNAMNESLGKKIFFLVIFQNEIYMQLNIFLRQRGFIEGRDFINGRIFLSELHGVPLDSWEIIENL